MNTKNMNLNLQHLGFQRNAFFALSCLLALSVIILTIMLSIKKERVVIIPTSIDKEIWVESNKVSPTYLEQYAYFIGNLLLNKTPASANQQIATLLRHTDPSYYGEFKRKLVSEEESLTAQGASYVFFPVSVEVRSDLLRATLVGDRLSYISGKQISKSRETYTLSFRFDGSRLLLTEVSLEGGG